MQHVFAALIDLTEAKNYAAGLIILAAAARWRAGGSPGHALGLQSLQSHSPLVCASQERCQCNSPRAKTRKN